MNFVERVRKHPARPAIPWTGTLIRPIFGHLAERALEKGKVGKAEIYFGIAAVSDTEGYWARFFNAVTALGAVGDPIADGVLRGQMVKALAPEMPKTMIFCGAVEVYNAKLNTAIQPGREKPFVPFLAKIGSAVQAVGVFSVLEGMRRKKEGPKIAGAATIAAGTLLRGVVYTKEYRRIEHNPQ